MTWIMVAWAVFSIAGFVWVIFLAPPVPRCPECGLPADYCEHS